MQVALICDIETTGLDKFKDDITEFGWIRIDPNTTEILDHGVIYFYKDSFNVEATQHITGLTREFLSQYSGDFEKNLAAMMSLMSNTVVIGKNSKFFDVPFIQQFIRRWGTSTTVSVTSQLDVQELFTPIFKQLYLKKYNKPYTGKFGKLGQYIEVLDAEDEVKLIYNSLDKVRETEAHGALYDCVMTLVSLRAAIDYMNNQANQQTEQQTVSEPTQQSTESVNVDSDTPNLDELINDNGEVIFE